MFRTKEESQKKSNKNWTTRLLIIGIVVLTVASVVLLMNLEFNNSTEKFLSEILEDIKKEQYYDGIQRYINLSESQRVAVYNNVDAHTALLFCDVMADYEWYVKNPKSYFDAPMTRSIKQVKNDITRIQSSIDKIQSEELLEILEKHKDVFAELQSVEEKEEKPAEQKKANKKETDKKSENNKKSNYKPKPVTPKKTYDSDNFHASDFGDAEEFYDWYSEDFESYEEAEDYWETHR